MLRTSTEFYDEVLTTLNMEHCNLKDAPEPPSNGLIVNVLSSENRTIIIDLESLRHNPIFIPVGTKVYYGCPNNLTIVGTNVATCQESGVWDSISYICQGMS